MRRKTNAIVGPLALVSVAIVLAAAAPGSASRFVHDQLHLTRYRTASVDLNADGVAELLVYANDPDSCGSGGCNLYVLSRTARTFRVVSRITVSRPPVSVLPASSHGWRDLGVRVAGGGIRRAYEARLSFDGRSYPTNPTVPPARPINRAGGRVVIE